MHFKRNGWGFILGIFTGILAVGTWDTQRYHTNLLRSSSFLCHTGLLGWFFKAYMGGTIWLLLRRSDSACFALRASSLEHCSHIPTALRYSYSLCSMRYREGSRLIMVPSGLCESARRQMLVRHLFTFTSSGDVIGLSLWV